MPKKTKKPTEKDVERFANDLKSRERADATIESYTRYVRQFVISLDGGGVTQSTAVAYKERLEKEYGCPSTVNVIISALNSFFEFMGLPVKLKQLRVETKPSRNDSRDLSEGEYRRLAAAAVKEKVRLIIMTLCSMGLRVGELCAVTADAVYCGSASVKNKGKTRTVLIPDRLRALLAAYAERNEITSGSIFLNSSGKPISRQSVWEIMKETAERAGIEPSKVFPHNLRHLFAIAFYGKTKDI